MFLDELYYLHFAPAESPISITMFPISEIFLGKNHYICTQLMTQPNWAQQIRPNSSNIVPLILSHTRSSLFSIRPSYPTHSNESSPSLSTRNKSCDTILTKCYAFLVALFTFITLIIREDSINTRSQRTFWFWFFGAEFQCSNDSFCGNQLVTLNFKRWDLRSTCSALAFSHKWPIVMKLTQNTKIVTRTQIIFMERFLIIWKLKLTIKLN